LSLRAVVFDYGMVLSAPPAPEAHTAMLRITGLSAERLETLYWTDRHAIDQGKLTGPEFWERLAREAHLNLSAGQLGELNDWDARMWTTVNPTMLAWHEQLKQRGLLTAILSNMSENVHARMEREFKWLARFDVLVWSYRLGITKPDPAIYLHALKELDAQPQETLFLDDRLVNVEAAIALGMRGLQFSTVDQLRLDLAASGLDAELPLP
jgi:putative hydrolase of the HAD superfamily